MPCPPSLVLLYIPPKGLIAIQSTTLYASYLSYKRECCCMKETCVRESDSESYCCWCCRLLVRECAMSEREESVTCVLCCLLWERDGKSKCLYCVLPVCLLGLLACETDRGGCWLICSMEEQGMRWCCFTSIFLSTDTEGKGEKNLRKKEEKTVIWW